MLAEISSKKINVLSLRLPFIDRPFLSVFLSMLLNAFSCFVGPLYKLARSPIVNIHPCKNNFVIIDS